MEASELGVKDGSPAVEMSVYVHEILLSDVGVFQYSIPQKS